MNNRTTSMFAAGALAASMTGAPAAVDAGIITQQFDLLRDNGATQTVGTAVFSYDDESMPLQPDGTTLSASVGDIFVLADLVITVDSHTIGALVPELQDGFTTDLSNIPNPAEPLGWSPALELPLLLFNPNPSAAEATIEWQLQIDDMLSVSVSSNDWLIFGQDADGNQISVRPGPIGGPFPVAAVPAPAPLPLLLTALALAAVAGAAQRRRGATG